MNKETWPINISVLAQTAGPKAATLLPKLIPIFVEDGDLLMGWLAEALQVGEVAKFQHAAHRLKGNSASMGVLTLAQLADELEQLAVAGDLATAVSPFNALTEEYSQIKSALLGLLTQVE